MTFDTILKTMGVAALGSIATIWTGAFGYWNTDRSHDIEMVRISLSIMQGENKETSLQGRKFALRALEKYSDVKIPEEEFEIWAKSGTIPETVFPLAAVFNAGNIDMTPNYEKCARDKLTHLQSPSLEQIQNAKFDCYDEEITKFMGNPNVTVRAPIFTPRSNVPLPD